MSRPLKRLNFFRSVNVVARVSLGLIFVTAAVLKSIEFDRFVQHVSDFGLVYDGVVAMTALLIVAIEGLVGIALMLRWRHSLSAAAALLLLFIGVLIYGIRLGLDIDCGCFGPGTHVSLGTQLLADCALLAVCVIIYLGDNRRRGVASALKSPDEKNLHE